MAKWSGMIGFGVPEGDSTTGVYYDSIVEKPYCGDVLKLTHRWNNTNSVNGDINLSQQISIISDSFACGNFQNIRYAEFMGTKWKVLDITVQYPRLLLTLGGVYNG